MPSWFPNQLGFAFFSVDPDADVFKLTGELPLVGMHALVFAEWLSIFAKRCQRKNPNAQSGRVFEKGGTA
ncbi:MAG: hypothetical protein ACPIG6_08745 [Akkermansiaceae bacterium]